MQWYDCPLFPLKDSKTRKGPRFWKTKELRCLQHIAEIRGWVKGGECPDCRKQTLYHLNRYRRTLIVRCSTCLFATSVTKDTTFHRSRVPLQLHCRMLLRWAVRMNEIGLAARDLLSDVASRRVIDRMKSEAEDLAEELGEYTVKKPAVSTVRRMLDKLESELAKDNKTVLVRLLDDITKWAIQCRSARL